MNRFWKRSAGLVLLASPWAAFLGLMAKDHDIRPYLYGIGIGAFIICSFLGGIRCLEEAAREGKINEPVVPNSR